MNARATASEPAPRQAAAHDEDRRLLDTEAQAFLTDEVHLLDDREYERWLELFTEDCLYWMPVDPRSTDGALRLNVFYDHRARMEDRVARLTSGSAHTEDPPPMTVRTLSAVQVRPADDGELVVRSNFMLHAYRRGDEQRFAGRYLHRLVRADTGLRIAEKRVTMLGSDAPQRPLTFLF